KVDDLVVEQHEPPIMDQDILRAVVAMHQRFDVRAGFFDQIEQESTGCWRLPGGEAEIGFQAQALEKAAVVKDRLQLGPPERAVAMNGGKQGGELVDMIGNDLTAQEHLLPVLMRLRNGSHGNAMLGNVFEDEGRDRSWRGDALQ